MQSQMSELERDFLTIREAARRFRISPGRLRAAIDSGELPASQTGKRWVRLWEPDLIAFMRSQRVKPASDAIQEHARRRVAEIMGEGR
jgi:excisionase family DNA binding protein